MAVPEIFLECDSVETNLLASEKLESVTINKYRCRTPVVCGGDDCPYRSTVNICECPPEHIRKEKNVLLTMGVNRGMIHLLIGFITIILACKIVQSRIQNLRIGSGNMATFFLQFTMWYSEHSTIPLSYLIGIPFGWLLFGTFQYFVCIVILSDSLLDPWYFTLSWIVEIMCTLHIAVIIMIIKCLYVRTGIMEYCEKITWIGFTFLLLQGLAIILLLLPISNLFKCLFGDFSQPINFFIYWTMIAFPHIMILCFATSGCFSKMFSSFSRYLRYAHSWNKHFRVQFETTKDQVITAPHDNNIELQELSYQPLNHSNKNLQLFS